MARKFSEILNKIDCAILPEVDNPTSLTTFARLQRISAHDPPLGPCQYLRAFNSSKNLDPNISFSNSVTFYPEFFR
jgi:hypothetical protein